MHTLNETYFFETIVLYYLYKKKAVSTNDIENLFGDPKSDKQHVNNIISNKDNRTSYIFKKLMKYDQIAGTLKITKKGERFVEKKFKKRRHA